MLDLAIRLSDLPGQAVQGTKTWTIGQSHVSAFDSVHLTMRVTSEPRKVRIWVGDDLDPLIGRDGDPPLESYQRCCDVEGVKIWLEPSSVTIARTAAGASPFYLAASGDRLRASWKFERVVGALASVKPDVDSCRIFLKHNATQIRTQVIDDLFMLWPGEVVSFDRSGLSFREADVPDIVRPSTLREDAKATTEFVFLIAQAAERHLKRSANAMLELSGGLDSSCVALAACSLGVPLKTYGLIHDGAVGRQQRRRRRELVDLLGVQDHEFPSYVNTQLKGLEIDECGITPFDDNHRLPCVYAVEDHPAGMPDLIISGIGGDELCLENTFFRQEWEVQGSICTSSVVAATARADMFMRRGIWPISPLASQSVVDFCRALPKRLREKRLLNLLTLARAGLSDGFLFPRYSEHYGASMQHEAALFDFDSALRESIVADYGIADISDLLARARDASYGGFSYKLIGELYNLLKLETVLRRYIT